MKKIIASILLGVLGLSTITVSTASNAANTHKIKDTAASLPAMNTNPAVQDFIAAMHSDYGFDVEHLTKMFGAVHTNASVLKAIKPAAVPELQRSWQRYRARFLNERRLNAGLRFWDENAADLKRAEAIYGVPAEYIVAIIGVETEYGRNTGSFSVLEALSTLAFDYPPRAPFFRSELTQFLLMARENGINPLDYKGSYAGAIGIPQFMPSSQRQFAVDFDGDNRIDLRGSVSDAIGSVARYFQIQGWQANRPVAVPVSVTADPSSLVAAGIKPSAPFKELEAQGVIVQGENKVDPSLPAALIDLVSPDTPTEYWAGFDNFYVITRYNRSSFYAMSVFLLAQTLREAHNVAKAG